MVIKLSSVYTIHSFYFSLHILKKIYVAFFYFICTTYIKKYLHSVFKWANLKKFVWNYLYREYNTNKSFLANISNLLFCGKFDVLRWTLKPHGCCLKNIPRIFRNMDSASTNVSWNTCNSSKNLLLTTLVIFADADMISFHIAVLFFLSYLAIQFYILYLTFIFFSNLLIVKHM